MLFFVFARFKPLCFSYTIPLCWLVYKWYHNAFVYIYSDQLKPKNGILYDFGIRFFVSFVSVKAVSFSDSIPMRIIA